ncbi:MAG: 30S ribosomal protein S17 [Patescibacteria group bacterium UBA2103]
MSNDVTKESNGKVLKGTVVKNAAKDTITVEVSRYVKHPKYKKYQKRSKKFLVHNPGNTAEVGAKVSIKEGRPISKLKRFTLVSE